MEQTSQLAAQSKLLAKALLKRVEEVGDQSQEKDPVILCKFYIPECYGYPWIWYAIEWCPQLKLFRGLFFHPGGQTELRYYNVETLAMLNSHDGVILDPDFQECRVSGLKFGS